MRDYPQHGSGESDIACRAGELHEQRRDNPRRDQAVTFSRLLLARVVGGTKTRHRDIEIVAVGIGGAGFCIGTVSRPLAPEACTPPLTNRCAISSWSSTWKPKWLSPDGLPSALFGSSASVM